MPVGAPSVLPLAVSPIPSFSAVMSDKSARKYPVEVCVSIPGGGIILPAEKLLNCLDALSPSHDASCESFLLGDGTHARISTDRLSIAGYNSNDCSTPVWRVLISDLREAATQSLLPHPFSPPDSMTPAELVLHDKNLLHLGIHPDQLPSSIVVVGDPKRAFDLAEEVGLRVTYSTQPDADHRRLPCVVGELPGSNLPIAFVTHQLGIGAAEVCLAEILRAANYDSGRSLRPAPRPTTIVRFGTCGITDPNVPLGVPIISTCAVGCDWTGLFGRQSQIASDAESGEAVRRIRNCLLSGLPKSHPLIAGLSLYGTAPDRRLFTLVQEIARDREIPVVTGVTFNAAGFFETQGRPGPDATAVDGWIRGLFEAGVTNIEMESSIVLRQAALWRARALVVTIGVADRTNNIFASSTQYHDGNRNSVRLVTTLLERAASL